MSSAQELAEQIEADKQQVAEAAARISAAKDLVAEVAGQARALGMGRIAEALGAVETALDEAETGRQTLEGSLEKARWQVMAAIHGVGPGAPTGRYGEAIGGPDGAPPQGVPDILPPHLRTGDPIGEELMGQDPSLSPFQKEHEHADADRNMNPFQRGTRGAVRNIGDFKKSVDEFAKPTFNETGSWKPPTETYPTVGTPEPISTFTAPPQAHADFQNQIGNLVVLTVLVAEWAARGLKNRKRKKVES